MSSQELNHFYNTLYNDANEIQKEVLDVLTSVNGLEQGIVDYYGYYYSNNYDLSIEEVMEDFYN